MNREWASRLTRGPEGLFDPALIGGEAAGPDAERGKAVSASAGSIESQESRPYLGWVLVVLFLIQLFSIMDRLILSVLADDIKHELGLSDSELGFLLGFAFAAFYPSILIYQ